VQRRLQTTRQREQEANESELCQLHGLGSGQTRVMDWWRFEDGGGATRLASTCSSTCCDPPTPRPGLASPARDGCPSQSTPTCSTSWTTFRVRKACDEWRSAEPAEQQSQSVDSTVVRKTKRVTVRCVRGPRAAAEPAIAARGKISREDRAREGEAAPNRGWVHAADCDFECSV
jgi:hypothetical protein